MTNQFKKIISENIEELKNLVYPYIFKSNIGFTLNTKKPKIFVFLCGYYQNLGDMALTLGHKLLLERYYGDEYEIVMIPSNCTYSSVKYIKKIIKSQDIINILGGGNMDDIYISLENCRRHIIRSFRKNRIVLFPQTMSFEDDFHGKYRLKKSIRTYNSHPDLYIFTREEKSLTLMKKSYSNAKLIDIVPDIVLSINPELEKVERKGIHIAFRHDKEKKDNEIDKAVWSFLKQNYDDISIKDTVDITIDECKPENYDKTLYSYWKLLAQKRVVVTDRLHCMIFCVITGTPCVVFDNSNQKISGVYYRWLSDLKYVRLETEYKEDEFKKSIEDMYNLPQGYRKFEVGDKFDKLIKSLNK